MVEGVYCALNQCEGKFQLCASRQMRVMRAGLACDTYWIHQCGIGIVDAAGTMFITNYQYHQCSLLKGSCGMIFFSIVRDTFTSVFLVIVDSGLSLFLVECTQSTVRVK